MNYIKQINAFWNWRLINKISHAEADLYMGILHMFNSFKRPSSLTIPNSTLVNLCNLSDAAQLTKVRNKLVQLGLITYQKGKSGKAGTYTLCYIDSIFDNTFDNGFDNDLCNTYDNDSDNRYDNDCDNIIKEKKKKSKDNNAPIVPKKGKEKKSSDGFKSILDKVEDETLQQALCEFIKMRNKNKKGFTPHALELCIKKLFGMSENPAERVKIVEQSVMNCWQGFYELKDKPVDVYANTAMNPTENVDAIEAMFRQSYEK